MTSTLLAPRPRSASDDLRADTALVRRRYDRIAGVYDALDTMELGARRWRPHLLGDLDDCDVLEVGIGTGKNLPFYPPHARVTGIDVAPRMLARASARAARLGRACQLELADVQALPYADASFDAVVSTFVFCSVPEPSRGLREILRVLRPGGRLRMLEHVLSRHTVMRLLMRALDPLTARLWGAHLTRETDRLVAAMPFQDVRIERLFLDVVVRIDATRGDAP